MAISVAFWNGTQYDTKWIEYDVLLLTYTIVRHPNVFMLKGDRSNPSDCCSGSARP